MHTLRQNFVITLALLLATCVLYPALVTISAQLLFAERANGSLLIEHGKLRGSSLIGQSVQDWQAHPEYLWGRSSAAVSDPATHITYSSGSNLGPRNPALLDAIRARVETLRASGVSGAIPVDLVTQSASGLDPHISLSAAALQIPRIARERKLDERALRELVRTHTEPSAFGFLGEPRVNVLGVNLALDRAAPYQRPSKALANQ